MTCTETTSPTVFAVSAPASVAALTAPTSPEITTDTRPSPTSSRATMRDVRSLDHGVRSGQRRHVALGLDHAERVVCHWSLLPFPPCGGVVCRLVDRADDQRVDRWMRVAEPARRQPIRWRRARARRHRCPSTSNATRRSPPSTSTSRNAPLGIFSTRLVAQTEPVTVALSMASPSRSRLQGSGRGPAPLASARRAVTAPAALPPGRPPSRRAP